MFRHGSLRDDRRRRSLLEDAAASGDEATSTRSRRTSKAAETYTELARADHHARWSEFVPLRNWTVAALLLSGLLTIAALEAAHYFAINAESTDLSVLASLDLARADSLAGWFAALVMFSTAVLSLFIYSVRRFRLDDYRGRYRVWLWGAAAWLLMSIDSVANLRGAIRVLGAELSGQVGPAEGLLWWLAPWSLVLLWFGLRMLLDARACRTATASFLLGFAALAAGFVLPQLRIALDGRLQLMLAAGCSLLARWLLLFAHASYARHVLLEAHGQLPVRAARPKRAKKTESSAGETAKAAAKATGTSASKRDDLTTRIDPPHTSSYRPATSGIDLQRSASQINPAKSPVAATKQTAGASSVAAASRPAALATKSATQFIGGRDDGERPLSSKLSRADRKKLRKQQRAGHLDDDE